MPEVRSNLAREKSYCGTQNLVSLLGGTYYGTILWKGEGRGCVTQIITGTGTRNPVGHVRVRLLVMCVPGGRRLCDS